MNLDNSATSESRFSKSRVSRRLKDWIKETRRINRSLRKAGIEPNYDCGIRNGKFYEVRSPSP